MCLESAIITEFPLQKECDLNFIDNYFHDQVVRKNEKRQTIQNKESMVNNASIDCIQKKISKVKNCKQKQLENVKDLTRQKWTQQQKECKG